MNHFKESFNDYVRAILALLMSVWVLTLATLIIFKKVPTENQQIASSIIMFLLGVIAGVSGFYFSANPTQKKNDNNLNETKTEDKNEP